MKTNSYPGAFFEDLSQVLFAVRAEILNLTKSPSKNK